MNIFEKLQTVQNRLKAPKNRENTFGGFRYRSCEDILEAVKPDLEASGLVLVIEDELVHIGERYYIKATASVYDKQEPGTQVSATAYAREAESKKGMDDSQVTGTASSYARKYALNGLFLIDDTKDADTDEFQKQTARSQKSIRTDEKIDRGDLMRLRTKIKEANADLAAFCKAYGIKKIEDLPAGLYEEAMEKLERKIINAINNPA